MIIWPDSADPAGFFHFAIFSNALASPFVFGLPR